MPLSQFDYQILEMIENARSFSKLSPLNLGGPPGGYIGLLPQDKVQYDIAESGTLAGSGSLVDNLNHIRYRLDTVESAANARTLFLHNEVADIAGYERLLTIPSNSSEDDDSVVLDSGDGEVLIDSYITGEDGLLTILLEGGTWVFNTYCSVDNVANTTNIVIRVYKRDTSGTETELFNVTTDDINDTTATLYSILTVQPAYSVNTTDRLVVKYFATTTSVVNRTVHLYYEGTAHYSHIHTPFGFSTQQSSLNIYENDILVASGVLVLNFEGAVTVTDEGSNYVTVLVSGVAGSGVAGPGGSNREVQYNNQNVLDGDTGFKYYNTEGVVVVGPYTVPVLGTNTIHNIAQGASPANLLWAFGNDYAGFITGIAAGGSVASPQAVSDTRSLFRVRARGHDGTTYPGTRAEHNFVVVGDWTTSNHGTKQEFWVTPSGSTTMDLIASIVPSGIDLASGLYYNINGNPHSHQYEYGANLVWDSSSGYHVEPGMRGIQSQNLEWGSNITRSSLSLSNSTLYYIYLYNNSGTPAVEESTTAPTLNTNYAKHYWQKTGDSSRRRIGYFYTDGSGNIIKFLNTMNGDTVETLFIDAGSANRRVVNGGTQTAQWDSFSLSTYVPTYATHAYLVIKVQSGTSGDDGAVGVSPIDLGAGNVAVTAPNHVRGPITSASAAFFAGASWNAIQTSQTLYYRVQDFVGTGSTAYIECNGARFNI